LGAQHGKALRAPLRTTGANDPERGLKLEAAKLEITRLTGTTSVDGGDVFSTALRLRADDRVAEADRRIVCLRANDDYIRSLLTDE
jgi:hypothetical protein